MGTDAKGDSSRNTNGDPAVRGDALRDINVWRTLMGTLLLGEGGSDGLA